MISPTSTPPTMADLSPLARPTNSRCDAIYGIAQGCFQLPLAVLAVGSFMSVAFLLPVHPSIAHGLGVLGLISGVAAVYRIYSNIGPADSEAAAFFPETPTPSAFHV